MFFFNALFMNVNEKLKSWPTLTVVRLSNVKDLICPFSKNTFNTFGIRSRESSLSIVWKRLRVKSLSAVIKSKCVHCYWNKNKKKAGQSEKEKNKKNRLLVNEQWTHGIFNSKRRCKTLDWVEGRGGRFGSGGGAFSVHEVYLFNIHVMQRKLNGRIKCARRGVSQVEAWLKVTRNKNQVPWILFWCDVRATSPPFLLSFWFFLIWLRARSENGAAFIMEFQRTAADVSGIDIWCNKIYDVPGCGGKRLGGLQKNPWNFVPKQNQSSPASCFSLFLFFF